MRSLLSIFNFKNRDPLIAIALFAGVVVLMETTFSFMPEIKWAGAFQGRNLPSADAAPSIQVMGDSVAHGGIIATQMIQELPGNPLVFNSSLKGSGPEFSYFILKRQIAAGKKPSAIVYAPSPHTFASKRVALLVGGFCTWPEIFDILKERVETCEVIYGILCKCSYTLRYREQLGQLLRGNKPEIANTEPAAKDTPKKRHYSADKIHSMYKKEFGIDRFNEVFFFKFLELARENNIPVYWTTLPVLSAVYESRKPARFEEDYFKFLDQLCQHYGVRMLNKEFLIYEDDLFIDQTHLDKIGAEQFTRFLSGKLSDLKHDEARQSAAPVPVSTTSKGS